MKKLKQMTLFTNILGIIMVVIGILFLVSPIQSSVATVKLIACMLIAAGIVNIYEHFQYKFIEVVFNRNGMLIGIFYIILGIFMYRQEGFSIFVFSIMFGIFVFFTAIEIFEYSITMMKMDVSYWALSLILAILLIINSIILIAFPPLAFETLTIWISVSLIFAGISTVVGMYSINKTIYSYKNNVENYINKIKNNYSM